MLGTSSFAVAASSHQQACPFSLSRNATVFDGMGATWERREGGVGAEEVLIEGCKKGAIVDQHGGIRIDG